MKENKENTEKKEKRRKEEKKKTGPVMFNFGQFRLLPLGRSRNLPKSKLAEVQIGRS